MNSRRKVLPGIYIEPRTVVTEKGPIEFDVSGRSGPVILSVHGGIGGVDQARLITNWLDSSVYQLLCPSRPGYLGTPLSSGKTFEQQADLLASLLDHLQLEKVGVVCLSAGGPPAYQFAIRHPDRIWGLVAIDSVSGSYHPPEGTGPLTEAIFMSSPLMAGSMFWEILWPLVLGFALSGIIQAVVSHQTMAKALGGGSPKNLTLAALFGIASSSCSYAAVALVRSIFQRAACPGGRLRGMLRTMTSQRRNDS